MSTKKEKAEQEEVTAPQPQAGDLLREARIQAGISQQEVADRLRLKVAVIQSIDENNFEFEKVATFTRGYLRSYAKLVSVDEQVVLSALDGVDVAQHKDHTMQSFSRKTNKEKHDRRIMKVTWGIFAIIMGIWAFWWYQNQQDTTIELSQPETDNIIPAVTSPVAEPSQPASPDRSKLEITTKPVEESTPEAVSQPKDMAGVNESIPVELSEQEEITAVAEPASAIAREELVTQSEATEEKTEPEVAQTPEENKNNALTMNFSADCWIQVKDASGKTIAIGVKQAGRELSVSGEPPYNIILGAPEGVTMTFASEPVDLSGYTSGKVARFTLP